MVYDKAPDVVATAEMVLKEMAAADANGKFETAYVTAVMTVVPEQLPAPRTLLFGLIQMLVLGDTKTRTRTIEILRGLTDQNFGFKPEGKGPLKVVLEASMGHKAEAVLALEGPSESVSETTEGPKGTPAQVDLQALKEAVREVVAEEVRPIIRELARREAGPSFRDVVGGIGWIVGLMGIWLYLKSRRPRGG